VKTHDHHLLKITADGTPTIQSAIFNTEFHSMHGALTESVYVYLDKGFRYYHENNPKQNINVLEYGFGSGLNAFITAEYARDNVSVHYTSLELYPLERETYLKYGALMWKNSDGPSRKKLFHELHTADWEEETAISPYFTLLKKKCDFRDFYPDSTFDVIYYDAFGPGTQAELWGRDIFVRIFKAMSSSGVLTTFCVQGAFRRMLSEVGFEWEKLPGPPGKREMLRVFKP
jgi:tRNA U34 5-methylaminomethyl-2-thiouridine-forming methyltransferase MnmC